jgi:hypothetical protein
MMVYRLSRGTDPLILNSALYGGGRLTSRPGRFNPGINYGTHRTGTRWRSWLGQCATIWKVAGSIPDGVIGIFHGHNPSGRTMVLGLTQALTEMRTRNIAWG